MAHGLGLCEPGQADLGFAFDPDAEFIDITVPEKPLREKNTPDAAASDFISPKITPPAVVRAFVEQALRADPILMDLKNDAEFNAIKPEAITLQGWMLEAEE